MRRIEIETPKSGILLSCSLPRFIWGAYSTDVNHISVMADLLNRNIEIRGIIYTHIYNKYYFILCGDRGVIRQNECNNDNLNYVDDDKVFELNEEIYEDYDESDEEIYEDYYDPHDDYDYYFGDDEVL